MTRRFALLSFLLGSLLLARGAEAAWYPVFELASVRLEVGESSTIAVRAVWTGIWVVPWTPWTFQSTAPEVAAVSGGMESSSPPGLVLVTGVSPGSASIDVLPSLRNGYVDVTVVCGREDPIQPGQADLDAFVGRAIVLEALTSIAHRTTFTWYHGRKGDTSHPLQATGPRTSIVPSKSGTTHAWVLATTPCSSSMAEFEIHVRGPKKRVVRR